MHGGKGEVVGPATLEGFVGKAVEVRFPGNTNRVDCLLTNLSREPPPPLPGGYKAGDAVHWCGTSGTNASGDRIVHGAKGEVVGPATVEIGDKGLKVHGDLGVRFPGNKRVQTVVSPS